MILVYDDNLRFKVFSAIRKAEVRQSKLRYLAIASRPRMTTASQKDPSPKMTSKVDSAIFLSAEKEVSGTSRRHP